MVFPDALLARLRATRHLLVFSGAGVSAESGIPTFRDALTGLWARFDPAALATPEAFAADPALVWGWYEWRRMQVLKCQPNAAHLAIAELARHLPRVTVVTQNVDDLHERAGSRDVIHLHGRLQAPYCSACRRPHDLGPQIPDEPEAGRRLAPPACASCAASVRPGVVWFGESLPEQAWQQAAALAADCELMLVVGTSGLVQPAAQLPMIAHRAGAMLVQINPQSTPADAFAHHRLAGGAAEQLPALLRAAGF